MLPHRIATVMSGGDPAQAFRLGANDSVALLVNILTRYEVFHAQ